MTEDLILFLITFGIISYLLFTYGNLVAFLLVLLFIIIVLALTYYVS